MLVISLLSFFSFAFALAAAAAVTFESSTSSAATSSHPTHFPSSSKSFSRHLTHLPPKTTHPILSPHVIQPGFTPPVPHPFTHTNHPRPTQSLIPPPSQSGQKPISIVFEVLGGLFAAAVLLGFLRCCYNYKKTPHRDRIADILHRHHLQRELEELERNPGALRRPSLREPAPPYFPRPPSYDDYNPAQPFRPNSRTGYSAVVTHSPPPSPPMSQRYLPIPATTARSPPDLIPSTPSG